MSLPGPQPSLLDAARALLARDLKLLWRRRGDAAQPILFALLVVALFALALGGNPDLLQRVAAAVLWLSVDKAIVMDVRNIRRRKDVAL